MSSTGGVDFHNGEDHSLRQHWLHQIVYLHCQLSFHKVSQDHQGGDDHFQYVTTHKDILPNSWPDRNQDQSQCRHKQNNPVILQSLNHEAFAGASE